jgi:shikimate kinase
MGMMGAGKTTVGRALAARLRVPYADNDEALLTRAGKDASAVASSGGIDSLHQLEHDVLADALRRDDHAVVSAPGSIALDPRGADLLAGQWVVWLRATLATLAERTHHDPIRPLLGRNAAAVLGALMSEREPAFDRLANDVVDVDGLTVDAIVDRILADDQGRKSIESPNSCHR